MPEMKILVLQCLLCKGWTNWLRPSRMTKRAACISCASRERQPHQIGAL